MAQACAYAFACTKESAHLLQTSAPLLACRLPIAFPQAWSPHSCCPPQSQLYAKFKLDCPEAPVSRWMFEQLRPSWVRFKKKLHRISCCCTLCANACLLVKALHSLLAQQRQQLVALQRQAGKSEQGSQAGVALQAALEAAERASQAAMEQRELGSRAARLQQWMAAACCEPELEDEHEAAQPSSSSSSNGAPRAVAAEAASGAVPRGRKPVDRACLRQSCPRCGASSADPEKFGFTQELLARGRPVVLQQWERVEVQPAPGGAAATPEEQSGAAAEGPAEVEQGTAAAAGSTSAAGGQVARWCSLCPTV